MAPAVRQVRSLLHVAVPVAVAALLVCLAVINAAKVVVSFQEREDGVLWATRDSGVVAKEVAPGGAGARAGVRAGDVLLAIDGREMTSDHDVVTALHNAKDGQTLSYWLGRPGTEKADVHVTVTPVPTVDASKYYALALVGLLALVVGTSVRLRRPNDQATLHFFWLTVALFGTFAFTPVGQYDHLDLFFFWADEVGLLALAPLFLHFTLVFPDRPRPWVRTDMGRALTLSAYLPAILLGGARAAIFRGGAHGAWASVWLGRLDGLDQVYLSLCLLGGLALMTRALRRLRSVTARRQLRWIVWGSAIGAVPFVALYEIPFLFHHVPHGAEYTALLLGCIPLAFASAIVRYRLMDVEVIIKRALGAAAVVLLLTAIYFGTLELVRYIFNPDNDRDSNYIALFATLVAATVAPWLKNAIQAALDRLYYRDRYDYRRALLTFARELNSDLDLDRLSVRLVTRIRDTLVVDRIALLLARPDESGSDFVGIAALGFDGTGAPTIPRASVLGSRLASGHTVAIDDPVPLRRLSGDDAAPWREAGVFSFVPCVSNDVTIAVIATGRKAQAEPLNSEDMTLLGAVAGQAATALENARLYGQLRVKADEIERLHQFSDSVVESLSDGLVVVDLDDRVVRWNRRLEEFFGLSRDRAIGRRLPAIFDKPFLDRLYAARRESPDGATLYRIPLTSSQAGQKRTRLVNAGIAPFRTSDGTTAGSIIVLEDVTERANLEEQLRLSEKMAAIGLLAAGVAHEVNTPLTGISSFTQMLLEKADPTDPKTQLLEKIERQTFRAAKIVNSLLNLARPSDGEAEPVDLNAVIGDVLSLLEHQFRNSRIQVRKDLGEPALVVRGVEYKLQQVFLNLLLNARDAMAKGGWLSVTTRLDHGRAVVEVSDTGVGIPSEHIARIYDPFFTTKSDGRGTGLGLSVTYGIVQEHGGTLTCDSAAGQGTRFTLALPLLEDARTEAAAH
jgi:PAS domain S-box-containing protein